MSDISNREDRILTVYQAADLLHLCPGTIYHLVSQRKLPVIKISRRCIRFSREALLLWLDSLTQPVSTSPSKHRLHSIAENRQRIGKQATRNMKKGECNESHS